MGLGMGMGILLANCQSLQLLFVPSLLQAPLLAAVSLQYVTYASENYLTLATQSVSCSTATATAATAAIASDKKQSSNYQQCRRLPLPLEKRQEWWAARGCVGSAFDCQAMEAGQHQPCRCCCGTEMCNVFEGATQNAVGDQCSVCVWKGSSCAGLAIGNRQSLIVKSQNRHSTADVPLRHVP